MGSSPKEQLVQQDKDFTPCPMKEMESDLNLSLCTNLQCTRIGPASGMLSCFWFI